MWLEVASENGVYLGQTDEPLLLDLSRFGSASGFDVTFRLAGFNARHEHVPTSWFRSHREWPETGRVVLEATSTWVSARWFVVLHPVWSATVFVVLVFLLLLARVGWAGLFRRSVEASGRRDPLLGTQLGGSLLVERIGAGGFATVYLGQRHQGEVAVKVLRHEYCEDVVFRQRFMREIKVCSLLQHPNIVRLFDWGEEDGVLYLAMEYVDGATLRTRLQPGEPWTLEGAVAVIDPVMQAVSHAHERGVMHRDLKPENVMLSRSGQVKLLDFGIARLADATALTATSQVVGTLAYMAPERLASPNDDPASDQFSIGVMVYEMLAGRKPFPEWDGTGLARLAAYQEPPILTAVAEQVPEAVSRVVMRMLSSPASQRFADVAAARLALLDATALPQPPAPQPEPQR